MSSKSRESRTRQKAAAENAVEARVAKLKASNYDDQKMAKDPVLRKLEAKVRKAIVRIKAIDASDALNEALAQKKAAPKEQPKAKGKAKPAKGKGKAKSKPKKSE